VFDIAVIKSGSGLRPLIFWRESLIYQDTTVRHNYLYNSGRSKLAVSFQIRSDDRKAVPVTRHAFCRTDHVICTSKNIRTLNNFEVFDVPECFVASSVGSFLLQEHCTETSVLNYQLTLQKKYQKNKYHIFTPATALNLFSKPIYKQRNICEYLLILCLFNCSWITSIKAISFALKSSARVLNKPYGPPTTVTWCQLLRKQTNTGTSTARTADTHWSTRTRVCALSWLVTSAYAR
jgi:hypothetical protein